MDYNFLLKSSGGLASGGIIFHIPVPKKSSIQKAVITMIQKAKSNNPLSSGNSIKGKMELWQSEYHCPI